MEAKVHKIAVEVFLGFVRSATVDNTYFRAIVKVDVDGTVKPLILTGNAHPGFEDGSVIAVLNPDIDLLEEIMFRESDGLLALTEIVENRCDLMMHIWVDAYKDEKPGYINKYKTRRPSPAKFVFRQDNSSGHASYVEHSDGQLKTMKLGTRR